MSEEDTKSDIEPRRFDVGEVPIADILQSALHSHCVHVVVRKFLAREAGVSLLACSR